MSGKRYAIRYRDGSGRRVTLWMALTFDYDDTLNYLRWDFPRDLLLRDLQDIAEIISVDTDGTERVERPANMKARGQ
jgi:hypothetical protein